MKRRIWHQGWWHKAQKYPSANFGMRPSHVELDTVVLHSISLPPGQYGGRQIKQFFTNTLDHTAHPYFASLKDLKVSAHFLISRTGSIGQFVSCDDRAWHAGISHWDGRDNLNDFSIGIELEGLEGNSFEQEQYQQLQRLLQALRRRYPLRIIVGHEHVAKGRKGDPGAGFDWKQLSHSLGWPRSFFPAMNV